MRKMITSPAALRPARPDDADAIWAMLEPTFRKGDTYCVDRAIGREAALDYWFGHGHSVFVAEGEGQALGTYFLCANQQGGGAHVCNCGFVTHPAAAGKGVARTMLDHALTTARGSGYRAMQFNFVVSTNIRAVALWQGNGFAVVGRLPRAFLHPDEGYVDALVMYRDL
jgi:ribosomal protein S18 acetylase RimI-like enzyme